MGFAWDDDEVWIRALPYPIEIVAAYKRLVDAHLNLLGSTGLSGALVPQVRRFKKVEQQRDRFVAQCHYKDVDLLLALAELHRLAWPDIPLRERDHAEAHYGAVKK